MAQITVDYVDHMGSDLTTVNAARVSFGKESQWIFEGDTGPRLSDRDTKLIKYLAKHKHLSPFGHAFATFRVKAPIFVARQLVKHQYLRWNEVSRRYVDDEPEFYVPDVWRGRSADKKQGSEGVVEGPLELEDGPYFTPEDSYDLCLEMYEMLLSRGVATEMARMVLPTSQMTEWWWSGSLDAWAAMCKLRCAPDSQYESRVVANQISEVMGDLFPVSWASLMSAEVK